MSSFTGSSPEVNLLITRRMDHYREIRTIESSLMEIFLQARRKKIIDARQYKVLKMRWLEHKDLTACAKEFYVTRERIRQIEAKALGKIRRAAL